MSSSISLSVWADGPQKEQEASLTLSEPARLALEYVAKTEGTSSENLVVINEHKRIYALTNRTFWGMTVFDQRTRHFHQVLVDLAANRIVDVNEVEAVEKKAYLTQYGKLDPDLYERLQSAGASENIPVIIWLSGVDLTQVNAQLSTTYSGVGLVGGKVVEVKDLALLKQIRQERAELLAKVHLAQAKPLTDFLMKQGYQASVSQVVPIVKADLSSQIIQEIAVRNDVAMIYLAGARSIPQLDSSVSSQWISEVWATNINGDNVDIAILEKNAVEDNSYLDVIATYKPVSPKEHPTQVAGVAASSHSTWRGVAYKADIISANHEGTDLDMEGALRWAVIDQDADVVNISEIFDVYSDDDYMHPIDRVMDYIIRTQFVTIVAAAGNMDFGNHIGSPAKAYGVITVGGINDIDTAKWSDDQMYDRSAWKNPRIGFLVQGDREKPEVVAVGENIRTITLGGNPTPPIRGTSLAAPQVAGLAALMMDKHSSLKLWPEAVKAIIMASAIHNIEGPPAIRQDGVDDRDGAGAIVATKAVEIAATRSSGTNSCNVPCWWGNYIDNVNFPVDTYRFYDITVSAGDKVRVGISWHSSAAPDYLTDPLNTNLDLAVFDPYWQNLAGQGGYSASWDNSYEIVEFDAPHTGTYHIGVYKFLAVEDSNWLGVAWTRIKRYDAGYLSHSTPGLVLPDQDYRVCFTIRNEGHFEWPVGGGNPIHLGYHWYDTNGVEVPVSRDYRTGIGANRPQGDIVEFCGWVRTPATLGHYTLQWDMVHEGVTWFANSGDQPLDVSVHVVDTIYPTYLPIIFRNAP